VARPLRSTKRPSSATDAACLQCRAHGNPLHASGGGKRRVRFGQPAASVDGQRRQRGMALGERAIIVRQFSCSIRRAERTGQVRRRNAAKECLR
jgi:hypothetical protein